VSFNSFELTHTQHCNGVRAVHFAPGRVLCTCSASGRHYTPPELGYCND